MIWKNFWVTCPVVTSLQWLVVSLLREVPCSKWHKVSWNFFIQGSEAHGNQGSENPPHLPKGKYIDSTVRSIFQQKSTWFPCIHLGNGGPFPNRSNLTDPTPLGTLRDLKTKPLNWTAWKLRTCTFPHLKNPAGESILDRSAAFGGF